ncbi:amidophosphoribosyltransferase [Atopobium sp. oral taxon 810]|uniref:amidophosphoribosyltransferase n=1 Tax=Atopobium sp. oral taxon 810 TaxID=712158 RepID=UPI0003965CF1|nr:amidophosphoribosyltransferase [Atopobium sp. oral taxon 810]ERI04260.1 putative amidophosphoribosyltransferase [Atopobium sp. oral taxon 810 str. F0209]
MGGFFGAVSHKDVALDVYFGVDYHSHLGTRRAGMVLHDPSTGFQRKMHSIENSPFRTKFERDLQTLHGPSGIGCISDNDPQPLIVRSRLGTYALTTVGCINNTAELVDAYIAQGAQLAVQSPGRVNSTELIAALINQKEDFVEGIKYAQSKIDGSLTLLIMTEDGAIIAARDKMGRLPVLIGTNEDGYAVSFESFAYEKLGYTNEHELGSGEIVRVTAEGWETLAEPGDEMRICAFLWVYYGYPNSNYEGVNVETMRYRNGHIMAKREKENDGIPDVDFVAGVPDSGLPHGIGYANESGKPLARPFVKYTPTWPRSFMPANQNVRNRVAKMKQIPVRELIEDKKLLLVDDSIVRGTQLRETVDFLYSTGAAEVHMRSACPPIMYGCKYLSFSRSNTDQELIARRTIRELEGEEGDQHIDEYADPTTKRGKCLLRTICEELGFDSLGFQTLDGMLEAIGIDRKLVCTYCWDGRE